MILIQDEYKEDVHVPIEIIEGNQDHVSLIKWYMHSPCVVYDWLDSYLDIDVMKDRYDDMWINDYLYPE